MHGNPRTLIKRVKRENYFDCSQRVFSNLLKRDFWLDVVSRKTNLHGFLRKRPNLKPSHNHAKPYIEYSISRLINFEFCMCRGAYRIHCLLSSRTLGPKVRPVSLSTQCLQLFFLSNLFWSDAWQNYVSWKKNGDALPRKTDKQTSEICHGHTSKLILPLKILPQEWHMVIQFSTNKEISSLRNFKWILNCRAVYGWIEI